jgi:hydroxymethylglutaryl-CoA synthase
MWVKYFAQVNADIQNQLGNLWEAKPESTDSENYNIWLKSISKSKPYIDFVNNYIAPSETMSSEIGNMYTASIFMAMLSAIAFSEKNIQNMLFLAYGSGSKSKVFQGKINPNISVNSIKNRLLKIANSRKCISIDEYENQHSL